MARIIDYKGDRGLHLVAIWNRLNKEENSSKFALALDYGVSEKTVARDLEDLRTYIAEEYHSENVVIKYDRAQNGYPLVNLE